jgi:hypothetical protein
VSAELKVMGANGVSFDQVLAKYAPAVGEAQLASLQVGLASCKGPCDGSPCPLLRSVSWRSETEPTSRIVDPKLVFDLLVGTPQMSTAERATQQSVLDAVLESALTVRGKLGSRDQLRLDEYLEAVRSAERRVTQPDATGILCGQAVRPNFPDLGEDIEYRQNSANYNRGAHADVMADLLCLAFQCNLTRVVSYMLDDEYSEFVYDNVPLRTFTAEGSTEASGTCGELYGAQHGQWDMYASIISWNVGKVSELCQKLDRIDDGDGKTVLDNTIVFLGSCMHGSDHRCNRLPSLLVGGGAGLLRTDQHVDLETRPLRDLYYTLANSVYGMSLPSFGVDRTGAPHATVTELLSG